MQVETLAAGLDLTWQITQGIAVTLGAGYQFWSGSLHSGEDGNDLQFSTPEAAVRIDLRW